MTMWQYCLLFPFLTTYVVLAGDYGLPGPLSTSMSSLPSVLGSLIFLTGESSRFIPEPGLSVLDFSTSLLGGDCERVADRERELNLGFLTGEREWKRGGERESIFGFLTGGEREREREGEVE